MIPNLLYTTTTSMGTRRARRRIESQLSLAKARLDRYTCVWVVRDPHSIAEPCSARDTQPTLLYSTNARLRRGGEWPVEAVDQLGGREARPALHLVIWLGLGLGLELGSPQLPIYGAGLTIYLTLALHQVQQLGVRERRQLQL